MVGKLKSGKSILEKVFSLGNQDDILLIDSDEEEGALEIDMSDTIIYETGLELDAEIRSTIHDLKLDSQIGQFNREIGEKLQKVDESLKENRRALSEVDSSLGKLWNTLYNEQYTPSNNVPELMIEETYLPVVSNASSFNRIVESEDSECVERKEVFIIGTSFMVEEEYGGLWYPAKLLNIEGESLTVKFLSGESKTISKENIAAFKESKDQLKVGTEIIAERRNKEFHCGVIAEP